MGYILKAECWEKYPSGYHLLFIMAKGKWAKALKRKKGIIRIFIYENNGK